MNHNSEKKRKEKQDILTELESIKTLLDNDQNDSDKLIDEIPVLQETVDDISIPDAPYSEEMAEQVSEQSLSKQSLPEQSESEPHRPTTASLADTPPNQQPLFDTPNHHTPPKTVTPALKENPFLPQHIRKRLNGNIDITTYPPKKQAYDPHTIYHDNPSIMPEISGISPEMAKLLQTINVDSLIDSLVREMMPQIEIRLRQQLRKKLNQKK